ncbi:MAG: hypothetical protein VKO64_01860 [Candidatus Sericytochromatia bacterium]|nr:hypothetical protein [Candidatus Sericytochromatia bacterium]
MTFHEALVTYFQGEKIEALVFILPVGLLSLVFGAWLLLDGREAFMRGVALPCLVFGAVLAVTGGTVGFRTPAQVERLETALEQAPAPALVAEIQRMDRVNRNWSRYVAAYVFLVVLGLGLRFGLRTEFAHGVAAALLLYAGMGFVIDGFAERRAMVWTETLQQAAMEGQEEVAD